MLLGKHREIGQERMKRLGQRRNNVGYYEWDDTEHSRHMRRIQETYALARGTRTVCQWARGLFIYIPSGQNSRLYDQTCSIQCTCTNLIVQQKGVKFQLTAESVQSPYHKKGMFTYLQGTINLKAVSVSLAEHPVCTSTSPLSLLTALTLHLPLFYFI